MRLQLSSAKFILYLKVFVVDLLYVSVGCVLTWPSPLVGRLGLTVSQVSWVGSLMALGAALGPALTSWTMARLGRKPALLGAGGGFLASWVILSASTDFAAICVARIIGGAAMGVAFIGVPVYLTEISDVAERQAVTTFTEFFLGIGYLIVYIGGPNLSYEAVQAVCAVITLTFLAGFTMLPESPIFLVSKGERDRALEVLTDLRKSLPLAQSQLAEIEKYLEDEGKTGEESLLELLRLPGHTRAFLLSLFVLILQQASGVIVLLCYLEPILNDMSLPVESTTAAVIVGLGNLPSIVISPPMVRYLGTKVTMVLCSTIMAISVIMFTVFEAYEKKGYDLTHVNFIPILALFLYNVFFCGGLGPLTWSVVAEISPPKIKSFTCFASSTLCWLAAFTLLIAFEPVSQTLGPTAIYGFFATCLIIGTVIIQVCLPDTKGLSLQEIQDIMARRTTQTAIKESRTSRL